MNHTDKKIKITFAPGCFDNFDGSQEDLDNLIKELNSLAKSGKLLQNSELLETFDDFDDITIFKSHTKRLLQ